MSGHRKFSELEERMTPERRTRIGRIARKLGTEMDLARSQLEENIDHRRDAQSGNSHMPAITIQVVGGATAAARDQLREQVDQLQTQGRHIRGIRYPGWA